MPSRIPPHIRTQAVPAVIEATQALTPVLRRYPAAGRALSFLLAAQAAHKGLQTLRARLTPPVAEPERWTVTVKADDDLYPHALTLLAAQSETNWRAVEAELDYRYDSDGDRTAERPEVKSTPSERVERNFLLGGHPVFAYIETFSAARTLTHNGQSATRVSGPTHRTPEATFVAETEAGQRAILDALNATATASQGARRVRKPTLWTQRAYGGWERSGELAVRPVASVAVTDNQVQRIVDDILAFREMEPEYIRRGIPFHRGYLLYGPPGTGKTSAVKAIAHATESDLYAANLGTMNDSSLAEAVQGITKAKRGAILLLEDIDSFDAARQRTEDDEGDETGFHAGISTTGLLNALDGVETPHGLVTILTSNHPEALDAALIRPGRVDKKIEFGYPDDATVERHYEFFFGRKPSVPLYAAGRSGADLNEVFVVHMTDPEGAEGVLSDPVAAPVVTPTVTPRPISSVVPAAPSPADAFAASLSQRDRSPRIKSTSTF